VAFSDEFIRFLSVMSAIKPSPIPLIFDQIVARVFSNFFAFGTGVSGIMGIRNAPSPLGN
jgi:hypothetical protein